MGSPGAVDPAASPEGSPGTFTTYPPRSLPGFLASLFYGSPPQISPPLAGAPGPTTNLPGPPVRSLHDYPGMATRPLSPNLIDLRAQPAIDWYAILQRMVGQQLPQGGQ